MKRTQRLILAISAATALMSLSTPAFASQSVTVGTTRCTITAKAPTLTATKQLTGSVSVTCTAAVIVTIDTLVVELDGSVEQTATGTSKTSSVSVPRNGTVTLNTFTVTCPNTETGNEEYASKGRTIISGSTTWTAWDRTVPANDSFAC